MLLSSINLSEEVLSEAEIIIVGAGAVGLTMAVDLAVSGKSVILLEAGSTAVTKTSQRYFESAKSTGRRLDGLHLGRFRALGGTTNMWGGQLVRFDPIVFSSRPWAGAESGWPINRLDVDPYYDRALSLLGLKAAINDDKLVMKRLNINPHAMSPELDFFFTRWLPEANLAKVFDKDIRQLKNLYVVTDAPVVSLRASSDNKILAGVDILSSNGRRITLNASKIVLASGTIESARLLMLPLSGGAPAPWSNNPWLGRGFMDHVDCVVGEIKPRNKKEFHHVFDNAFIDGIKYQPKLKLSEFAQSNHGLLGISCHFIFNSSISEHLANAKIFFRALLKGKVGGSLLDLPRQIFTLFAVGLPMVHRYIRYQRMYSPSDLGIQIRLTGEQRMVAESCLRLLREVDALGVPLIELNWKTDGQEMEAISMFSQLTKEYLEASGLADVKLDDRIISGDRSFLDTSDDANHHMGMVRMADSPKNGVVDRNLKVFECDNLYVAGAAVYPSTGFANPTFTAIALGLRLSNHLQHGC